MKYLKIIFMSVIVVMFTMTSCTNEDTLVKQEEAVKSLAAKTSMQELSYHFNDDGTLSQNEGTTDNNPVGNILFDFCFEFEYPVTLSYNSGATVVINNFDELIDVLINMTDNLYIDGIAFPFNVLVFNQASGAVEVQTINNENEFITLIESCDFDEDDCVYTDDFDPVCIEIQDQTGESFIVQFPNMSYAICEGFTQNDVVTCDEVVDPGVDDNECFEFNYPISVVTFDGTTIVVQSDEEWETIMYTIQGFDFVYPFEVTLLDGGSVQTIATDIDFINLLDTCYDIDPVDPCDCTDEYAPVCVADPIVGSIEYTNFCFAQCDGYTQNDIVDCASTSECSISNLIITNGDCNADGTFSVIVDFDVENPTDQTFDINVEMNPQVNGIYNLSDLPITLDGLNYFDTDWVTVYLPQNCIDTVEFRGTDCDSSNDACWTFVFPVNLTVGGVDSVIYDDAELQAIISNPSVSFEVVYPFDVDINGVTQTIESPNYFYEIGEWENICE